LLERRVSQKKKKKAKEGGTLLEKKKERAQSKNPSGLPHGKLKQKGASTGHTDTLLDRPDNNKTTQDKKN